jgi:hypothetical protein
MTTLKTFRAANHTVELVAARDQEVAPDGCQDCDRSLRSTVSPEGQRADRVSTAASTEATPLSPTAADAGRGEAIQLQNSTSAQRLPRNA